jgi:hypothetical protein
MKLSNKTKALVKVGLVVFTAMSAAGALMVAVSYPTSKHIEVAKQMNAGPDEKTFQALMSSPEATWSITFGMVSVVLQLILFVLGVYLTYRYIRKNRLSNNPSGVTTGIITVASVLAGLFSSLVNGAYGVNPAYIDAGFHIVTTIMNIILSFVFAFIITLLVERSYDRKHSFAVE